ncbi:hypothetical protein [Mycolicibacterium elephantis]|uniref:hypothetical protein n=1 Tax=Mycolicibacterium elephantis TaxID=81858 RepID=UPI0007E933B0|nr:hypothetical protein [Mycolicibacterium elephantis]OBB20633.1 hypothetical protein A5762_15270 [Mycolicibacterium elephantis]
MAGRAVIKLDNKAIAKLAKGAAAQSVVTGVANRIAAAAEGESDVREYTTDRAVASVSVAADDQAADGVLSRAASSVGITINTSRV